MLQDEKCDLKKCGTLDGHDSYTNLHSKFHEKQLKIIHPTKVYLSEVDNNTVASRDTDKPKAS